METYKTLVETSFQNAENNISKITNDIITMDGMSGTKTRHFYNNLLNTEDARYLEIGTWKGSSVCSAMCGNKAKVVCIDNWSEFGGPKAEFLVNFEKLVDSCLIKKHYLFIHLIFLIKKVSSKKFRGLLTD